VVDSQGRRKSKICAGESLTAAIAFAAGWQTGGLTDCAVIVVQEIEPHHIKH